MPSILPRLLVVVALCAACFASGFLACQSARQSAPETPPPNVSSKLQTRARIVERRLAGGSTTDRGVRAHIALALRDLEASGADRAEIDFSAAKLRRLLARETITAEERAALFVECVENALPRL